jgi:acetyl esterase
VNSVPGNSAVFTGRPSAEMQVILDQLAREDAGMTDPTLLPSREGREMSLLANRRWNRDLPELDRVDSLILTGAAGTDIEARLFTPKNASDGLIFYIHGGGFAFCDIDTHERFTRCLAIEARCAVLSITYRLAPEFSYPAGLQDCIALYRSLDHVNTQHPWTRGPTAIAGDSAGANLALALIIHEQRESRNAPDFAMLFYGVYGTNFDTRSYQLFADGPGLTRAKMVRYLNWYAANTLHDDPLISINTASDEELAALPPLYLNAAEIDPLCSDTEDLHARLQALGRQDQVCIVPGVVHGFMQMTSRLSAAREATSHAAAAFRSGVQFSKNT